jgi:hypothetical protein
MWLFRVRSKPKKEGGPTGDAVSLLTPDEVESFGGLPSEAILGEYGDKALSPESFRPNPAFVRLLHRVIAEDGPQVEEMDAWAKRNRQGWLYVIDARAPEGPNGRVLPEDIVGAFEVRDGAIVAGSYQPNPNYRVVTRHGPARLTPWLRSRFVAALRRAAGG